MSSIRVIVPGAGEYVKAKITGKSVIIEQASIYDNYEQVPRFQFDTGNSGIPVYPRSIYQNYDGEFNSIIVYGTAESEGDEIIFYPTRECLPSQINIVYNDSYRSTTKPAENYITTNAVASLSDAQLVNDEGNLPSVIYVSARGADIAYSIESDPDQITNGAILKDSANPVPIEGISFIKGFRYLSALVDTPATLHVIFEY